MKNHRGRQVRYAVVGLGYISQIAVLPAFAHAGTNSKLVALVSGEPAKLKAMARKYRVESTYTYEQYSACLESGEIDAVYIALPNHMHRAYSEAAARAGVHILCEKPMAMNELECESMIAEAEKAGVKLMIAYRLHFERGNLQAIQWVNSGKIGDPRIFASTFSQQVKAGNSRLKKETGGPLYDLGIYCINAARYLFRAEPLEVMAWHSEANDKRFSEVPATTTAMLRFPGARIATVTCSFGAADRSAYEIVGTKGLVTMSPAYDMLTELQGEMKVGSRTTKKNFPKRDQFAPELIYFSNCILHDIMPEPSGQEGLADIRVIQAIERSAEINKPVTLDQHDVPRRPTLRQQISRPARKNPPRLVKAEPPAA